MATIQSGRGRITLFDDFCGAEWIDAETAASGAMGPFRVIGDGIADNDASVLVLESDGLSGIAALEAANTEKDATALATGKCFDVALMGTIIIEARVRFVDLDTKVAFIGLTNANGDDLSIEDDLIDTTAGTTIENTATNICGFYLSDEITEDEMWHFVYKSGTTAAQTDTTALESGVDAVAGEFNILRLEVDNNGTARWFIDGVHLKTLAGAISTTADLAVVCGVGTAATSFEYMYVDYLYVSANRDWTV